MWTHGKAVATHALPHARFQPYSPLGPSQIKIFSSADEKSAKALLRARIGKHLLPARYGGDLPDASCLPRRVLAASGVAIPEGAPDPAERSAERRPGQPRCAGGGAAGSGAAGGGAPGTRAIAAAAPRASIGSLPLDGDAATVVGGLSGGGSDGGGSGSSGGGSSDVGGGGGGGGGGDASQARIARQALGAEAEAAALMMADKGSVGTHALGATAGTGPPSTSPGTPWS